MTTFVMKRGGARPLRRRAHIAKYNPHGEIIGAWCERPINMSCNLTLGLPICKDCRRRAA